MRRIRRGTELFFHEPRRFAGRILGPKVLVTSVPKSGTNLLVHTLSLFPNLTFDGTTVRLPQTERYQIIDNIRRGCIVSAHMSKNSKLDNIITEKDIKVLFIIRDPRDVSVSLYHWIKKTEYHHFHEMYKSLSSDYERLEKIITGYEPTLTDGDKKGIASIDRHFRRLITWMDDQRCLTIRFEKLIGSRGGGDDELQIETIKSIARFLKTNLDNRDIEYLGENIFSNHSATFRKGQIGSWRNEFSEEHKSAFKNVAGQLLIDLGYEKDHDW
jgi:hypothetical protein